MITQITALCSKAVPLCVATFAFALSTSSAMTAPADAQSSVATDWQGTYYYANGTGQQAAAFELHLQIDGQSISGTTTEQGNLGPAHISGLITETTIAFTKTYDGGDHHSVQYRGTIKNGRFMNGVWAIGDFTGTFTATAVTQSPRAYLHWSCGNLQQCASDFKAKYGVWPDAYADRAACERQLEDWSARNVMQRYNPRTGVGTWCSPPGSNAASRRPR